jgi:hypothetical protein
MSGIRNPAVPADVLGEGAPQTLVAAIRRRCQTHVRTSRLAPGKVIMITHEGNQPPADEQLNRAAT